MPLDTFPHDDVRYKCCCLHVTRVSKIIGIIIFAEFLYELIVDFEEVNADNYHIYMIILDVVQIVCIIFLFVGLFFERSKLLLIPIIILILEEVVIAIGIAVVVLENSGDVGTDEKEGEDTRSALVLTIVIGIIWIALNVVALYFIYRSYKYLKDFESHKKAVETVAMN